ncbi:MAG: YegP family protein [bacterium]
MLDAVAVVTPSNASGGQFKFHLKAANGEIVLPSETYTSKTSAEKGIDSVRVNAPIDARYERKTSSGNQPHFVLKAANGEPLGRSEMYASTSAMETGIASVKANAPTATVVDLT